ncbi:NADH:ubiquinone oxidoreductase, NADH-binding (51 kD) subunit [Mycolicibacterium chubuense NBB4]|uniref:NADH:ubiquinone oxidoreductase, NADH-binding (51 kD) subunit n=1 Tax=Mycolicibacterium chubuense (strain NBB4) TaxID=710421 RepID=I4BD25_MYCCN|nr:NADH-ubiquinone oxidoreductase-F iron-sulfur binding region domain-containing protein [Mycolicibacterium chubuense]AFM15182.1 NADH:ubiquinone oxidoreductase, NADH-binding (51 kD) subunit [Mycolicibacterium chubuense NBB4]
MNHQPPATIRRLLAAEGPALADHHRRFGPLPRDVGRDLITELDGAGLSGRGGGGFPTGRKIAAVTGRKPVVVANGAEGEPLSRKDAVLLTHAPHLVLDGLAAAADAVRAGSTYVYVPSRLIPAVSGAIDERRAAGLEPRKISVVEAPDTFVAGEESAVVRRIEGGPALPRDRTVITAVSGVHGRPTLVNNVETLAHIGLIARFGAQWFRSVGDETVPGTMLVTLSGAVRNRHVVETPTGSPLADVITRGGGTDPRTMRAVLLGGYHGTWIPGSAIDRARLSRSALVPLGASPGAGIVHALAVGECGLARTADFVAYLADQSARQCGPCLNGLPRLAELLDDLAYGRADDTLLEEVRRTVGLVDGRGSCRHPDGTARLVRSALEAFASDIEHHRRKRCEAALAPAPGVRP